MSYKEHIDNMNNKSICPFCEELWFALDQNNTAFVLAARAPYIEDHILICTKSHKKYLPELSTEELQDIQSLLIKWEKILQDRYGELVVFLRQWEPFWVTWKSLDHFHRHIVPNFTIKYGWTQEMSDSRKFFNDSEYEDVIKKIKLLDN